MRNEVRTLRSVEPLAPLDALVRRHFPFVPVATARVALELLFAGRIAALGDRGISFGDHLREVAH